MAKSVNINIRVDSELKRKAESVYAELGMNLSTALNVFLRASVRSNGLPFDLRLNAEIAETAKQQEAEAGNGLSRVFDGADMRTEDAAD